MWFVGGEGEEERVSKRWGYQRKGCGLTFVYGPVPRDKVKPMLLRERLQHLLIPILHVPKPAIHTRPIQFSRRSHISTAWNAPNNTNPMINNPPRPLRQRVALYTAPNHIDRLRRRDEAPHQGVLADGGELEGQVAEELVAEEAGEGGVEGVGEDGGKDVLGEEGDGGVWEDWAEEGREDGWSEDAQGEGGQETVCECVYGVFIRLLCPEVRHLLVHIHVEG